VARTLEIRGLRAETAGKEILKGIDLDICTGKVHALMGPNGSGKSTLANVLMGHPSYTVTGGTVRLDGQDFLALKTNERAERGVFLAFQYPVEVPGVTVGKFLKRAVEVKEKGAKTNVAALIKELRANMDTLGLAQDFINRSLNAGFSGGEKKRMEIVQMLTIKPSFAILDETDSGLDIDALKIVAGGVNRLRGADFGALVITHYQRILNLLEPDVVHILYQGRIVSTGGKELVQQLEAHGYDWVKERFGAEEAVHV
jgi:Fe-S cluster assembly ATP-binding protein